MNRSDHTPDRSVDRAALPLAVSLATLLLAPAPIAHAQGAALPSAEQGSVVLEADSLVRDEKADTITAEGSVEARYRGRTLRTKKLVYNLRERTIRAQGAVEIIDDDGSVRFADEVEVDEELNTGYASNFAMRIPGMGTTPPSTIAAAAAVRPAADKNELRRVVYTACPICKAADGEQSGPTWTLRARRATQNQSSDMISYRDVVIKVGPVPIVYLPYLAHPDPSSGPRSGLLIPDAGQNDRLGIFYQQPIHWAISPYQDLTFAPRVHEKVNPLLGLKYRKQFYSGELRLNGSVTHERDFTYDSGLQDTVKFNDPATRSHIFGDGRFRINDFWNWGFGVERASDDTYLQRYDIDDEGRAAAPFVSGNLRLISQLYLNGQSERTYGSISAVSFQGLRPEDDSSYLPVMLPIGEVEHVIRDPLFDGQLRLQGSSAALFRGESSKVDSARVSGGAEWRRDRVIGAGVVVAPFAMARTDVYRIERPGATADERIEDTFTRSVGAVGAEARWPLLRTGKAIDTIVEPIAMVALGSNGGNDPRIVNEDSQVFELDDSNLFRPNGAPNFDLWEPGPRASLGLRATAQDQSGRSATAFVGRRWRKEDAAVFTPQTNLNGTASDYIGAVSADLGRNFGASVRLRVADENLALQRIDAQIRSSIWRVSADARYFRVSEGLRRNDVNNQPLPSEEVAGSVEVRLSDRWRTNYASRVDLNTAKTLSQSLGLVYQDDCTFLQLSYTREENTLVGPSTGFQIRIGLSTLGEFNGN